MPDFMGRAVWVATWNNLARSPGVFVSLTTVIWLAMGGADSAHAQGSEPAASTSGTDMIGIRFAMPADGSIRDQYINANIFRVLLRDRAGRQPDVRPCQLRIWINDQFPNFDLLVTHTSPAQRIDCLRGLIRYVLHETINEADFLVARESEARFTATWREPHPRYSQLAERASERLAYLAIYQKYSPLHEIYSVGVKGITELSFGAFSLWLLQNREEKLIAFDGKASLLQVLGLPARDPMILVPYVSLRSPRAPSGVLVFDNERFGVLAHLMISVDHEAHSPRKDSNIWERFSCNRSSRSRRHDAAAVDAIASITCSSHSLYGTNSWVGLAIRKSDAAEYSDFCRQVRELADDADVVALVRGTPEKSRGLYVLLPPKCELKE